MQRDQTSNFLKLLLIAICFTYPLTSQQTFAQQTLVPTLTDIKIKSSVDGSMQPARWFSAAPLAQNETLPRPLLVMLHTWSGNYKQGGLSTEAFNQCKKRNWAYIHPDFRGPNRTPKACGSKFAIADVIDAVEYAKKHAHIDPKRIYLLGTSGGGHMALLMACKAPKVWAGVSAWVPVTDITAWHAQCKKANRKYWKDIEGAVGGAPGSSPEIDAACKARSPLFHLQKAKGVRIDLNVGIHDGHTGSIPITHSLFAFNRLADANNVSTAKLTDAQIQSMRTSRKLPADLANAKVVTSSKRLKKILFQRSAGSARLTIFDGGHEGDTNAAIDWLSRLK
jgi:poly(3-hydroxybutyrate) depolymerase